MKKVLIIEDEKAIQKMFALRLEGKVKTIPAMSILEAEKLFFENLDLSAILVDACVPGETINTITLVKKIRQTFFGPMIAISGNYHFRELLVEAGCSHECEKLRVVNFLLRVLDIK